MCEGYFVLTAIYFPPLLAQRFFIELTFVGVAVAPNRSSSLDRRLSMQQRLLGLHPHQQLFAVRMVGGTPHKFDRCQSPVERKSEHHNLTVLHRNCDTDSRGIFHRRIDVGEVFENVAIQVVLSDSPYAKQSGVERAAVGIDKRRIRNFILATRRQANEISARLIGCRALLSKGIAAVVGSSGVKVILDFVIPQTHSLRGCHLKKCSRKSCHEEFHCWFHKIDHFQIGSGYISTCTADRLCGIQTGQTKNVYRFAVANVNSRSVGRRLDRAV